MPRILIATFALGILSACANYSLAPKDGDTAAGAGQWGAWDDTAGAGDQSDTGDDWGSETEDDFTKMEPAPTRAYVFVVNASRDTVSRISVPSLSVLTADVGVTPALVQTSGDYTRAVVFNTGDDSVTIVDAETLATTSVPVRTNFNAMEMSPDGRWVLCYHSESSDVENDDPGLRSFSEVSLVDAETGTHHPLAVGFEPRSVRFTSDSQTALVAADQFVAVIDLGAETLLPRMVQISDDTLDPPRAEEILLEPTGRYAFVRQFGLDEVVVLDMADQSVGRIAVGSNPTDLDLSPDGSLAAVVSRGANTVTLLDTADPLGVAPRVVDLPSGELLGSLTFSPDGAQGILYTTAAPVARYTAWDLETDAMTVRNLVKPIQSVAVTPDGGTLLVEHTLADAEDADTTSPYYGKHALTLIDLEDHRPNALALASEIKAYSHSSDGAWGFFVMEGVNALEVLDYSTLLFEELALESEPVHVGTLPLTHYVFVNQEHPLGRLSFYDPDTRALETITGFELNDEIERE